jgi:hypothetical protein
MGYIGRQLSTGQYRKLDSIEGSFDGSAKGFNLEVDSTSVTPAAQNCLLSINGVIQEPFVAFSVTGSAINFAEAPESSDKFFGVIMGEAAFIAANTVGANELGVTAGTAEASKVLILNTDKGVNDIGSISGSATATASFSQILVGGSDGSNAFAVISGSGAAGTPGKVRISGSLQSTGSFGRVEGSTLQGTIVTPSQTNITSVGTIGTGTWEATDVGVAHGGTGASTLTDGGVLLGSDTNAITAMAVLADSEMIVGNGSTDPVAESGATLRTSIGVGTGDSPQLTAVNIGDAADTTLSRNAAGVLQVESTILKMAGKETIWIPSNAMTPTETNGCADITAVETTSDRPDMYVLDFDKDSDEHAQFSVAFPKSWNLGTVTFQVFWSGIASADDVDWALQGVAFGDNDSIDTAYGTAVVVTDNAQGAVEECLVSAESGDVTIAGSPADDQLCYFRIFRDVSGDAMAGDARLHGIKLFFTTDIANDD